MAKATKFDRQDAVDKATHLYWEKGFHGTSMRNLQDVIDMRPGSIYACFGSKEGLFKEVLNNYAQMGLKSLADCVEQSPSPLSAIKTIVHKMVVDTCEGAPSGMCMLVKTISELTEENADLLNEARGLLVSMELAFTRVFEAAKVQGELAPSADAQYLARYLQVQIMGLRTYARVHNDTIKVQMLIDNMFEGELAR